MPALLEIKQKIGAASDGDRGTGRRNKRLNGFGYGTRGNVLLP
jgi:hypothetical protein